MVRPITSYPCSCNIMHAAELSIPPLMPINTRLSESIAFHVAAKIAKGENRIKCIRSFLCRVVSCFASIAKIANFYEARYNLFIKTYLFRMLKNGEFLDVSWEKSIFEKILGI